MDALHIDYFEQKEEFLPTDMKLRRIYTRRNELHLHVDNTDKWIYRDRVPHPDAKLIIEIETNGYKLVEERKENDLRKLYS